MEELALKIEHVSKQYRLGAIGGGTLKGDLQTWWARKHGREDPNSKIGSRQDIQVGERFLALDDVSFEVKKGEAVGIIGHNGAGKSTLLKLLSRVTAPTEGKISINGRIASMLEVGTGFHPELTGRENVYMNGAILGMTRAEIDKKFDQIVEFAEMEKFIDTPVKRYSSGMYVKLAFSVAAHLDSEIMIMDEVLAVGDVAFQKKCLDKMRAVAKEEGRTVLYVSHNMSTIRQLCDRVVVLDHGKRIFDGDVEGGLETYLGNAESFSYHYDYPDEYHKNVSATGEVRIKELFILSTSKEIFETGDQLPLEVKFDISKEVPNLHIRCVFTSNGNNHVGTMLTRKGVCVHPGDNQTVSLRLDLDHLMGGHYKVDLIAYQMNEFGHEQVVDGVYPAFYLEIENPLSKRMPIVWLPQYWGYVKLNNIEVNE